MKKFNIAKAKAGAPVCTKNGMPARIICWDAKNPNYPIIALVGNDRESIETYTKDGFYDINECEHYYNLMMAPSKHEGWVLIDNGECIAHIYNSAEEAEEDAEREIMRYSAIAHIEWEE